MGSIAQDAIEMGLDPEVAPDGQFWCISSCRQSEVSKEIWGDLKSECGLLSSVEENQKTNKTQGNDLNIGDIVLLKSGGPKMTVSEIDGDKILCSWFDGNSLKRDFFNKKELSIRNYNEEEIEIPEIDIDDEDTCSFPW